ncbi:MAG: hypothetical protein RLZZ241_448 [Bacteroidota bacterium]|jgi:hypothetical protein
MLFKIVLISLALWAAVYAESGVESSQKVYNENSIEAFDCTLTAQCILISEAGIIRIAFSITAPDCEAARQGIVQAVKGFIKGF